jgi:hypothetical protein
MFGSVVCHVAIKEWQLKGKIHGSGKRSAYRILSRKCQETRPLKRTWCKLEDNIKVYLNRHPLSNDGLDSTASESDLLKNWSMVMSRQINR